MRKIYQLVYHRFDKQKLYPCGSYFETELEAIETLKKGRTIGDDEVYVIMPVYVTEKRYKWIFDKI